MITELEVINSVLKAKDVGVLYSNSIDDLMVTYQDVWQSIKSHYNKYQSVPDISIMQQRHRDLEVVEVPGATQFYVDKLREEYMDSRIESIMEKAAAAKKAGETPARVKDKMQQALSKLDRVTGKTHDINIKDTDAAEEHLKQVALRAEARGGLPGIATGISFIDSAYTSGLAPGDFTVILGYTGRKKSLLTTLIACNAFMNGYSPLIVSLEMTPEKVRNRAYTILGSGMFQNSELELGKYSPEKYKEFSDKLSEMPNNFYVVSNDTLGVMSPNNAEAKVDRYSPDMLIFDYCQLGSDNANSQDMTAKMRNMSNEFKTLGVRREIPVVAISSATPESGVKISGPPMVENVAYSKQLAYDADLSIAVHGHDDSNLVEVVGRKNRNGPLFAGYLDWDINNGILEESFGK
jgi:replicative DNA helicase